MALSVHSEARQDVIDEMAAASRSVTESARKAVSAPPIRNAALRYE